MASTFDILKFGKRLRESGQFSHEQVDAFTGALIEGFELSEDAPAKDGEPSWVGPNGAFLKSQRTQRNKTTAALFALFLGFIGIHKFYLGQPGVGFLYLLFCWTFIPAVIAFFESLFLFSMSERDFAARYG